MPTAVRTSSGASVINLAATRPDPQPKSITPRPQTENGHPRRNSTSNHKRPSSAPGDDNNKPNGAHVADVPQARDRPKKPPLMRSKSDHPSRGLHVDTSTDSSNDEQTVAAAEDFGTRHGFDGHYQSEDIISQLANVGVSSPTASRPSPCAVPLVASLTPVSARTAGATPALQVCRSAVSKPWESSLLDVTDSQLSRVLGGLAALCDSGPTVDLWPSRPRWNPRLSYLSGYREHMLIRSIIPRAGTCISQTRGTRRRGNQRQSRSISRIGECEIV